ncbi:MAG: DNA-3-methyladenine glycosylase [Gemmatimonadota bacterium]
MSGGYGPVLSRAFFLRTAPEVARDLLGAVVVSTSGRTTTVGRIVETEAYLGAADPASHAFNGRRHASNEHLYSPPGTWYVYLSYGVHWCANLVTGPRGVGAAVLIRGIEPLEGLPAIRRRRGKVPERHLANGPGKLTQALGITRTLDGQLMRTSNAIVREGRAVPDDQVRITARIGITRATRWPLRFLAQ